MPLETAYQESRGDIVADYVVAHLSLHQEVEHQCAVVPIWREIEFIFFVIEAKKGGKAALCLDRVPLASGLGNLTSFWPVSLVGFLNPLASETYQLGDPIS